MKLIIALVLAALPLMAQGSVSWESEYAVAVKRAKAEKKMIFMDLWAEWCPPCQYLRTKVFPMPEAQTALVKFVPLSMLVEYKDRRPIEEGMRLAKQYKLEAFPTLLILDENGKEIRRRTGGFSNGAELVKWLENK